jgi:hypothetical protein
MQIEKLQYTARAHFVLFLAAIISTSTATVFAQQSPISTAAPTTTGKTAIRPQSENMHFYAGEYSKALGRTITFQDIAVEAWRHGLVERGLPVHLVDHLATMADLHRAGRYDRMSDDVLTLTGQGPLTVQDFVKKNAATFTAPVSHKEAQKAQNSFR